MIDYEQARRQRQTEDRQRREHGEQAEAAQGGRILRLEDYGAERLSGQPPPIKWLVQDAIPLAAPVVFAGQGGVGKSYKLLQLCYETAIPQEGNVALIRPVLGGRIVTHGRAVMITSEDDDGELHRRLAVLDPLERRRDYPGRLITIALPNVGGPLPLFASTRDGVQTTPEWDMLCDQLAGIPDLALVGLDPLSTFAQAELDADNTAAAFITGKLGALAAELGATVLASHHMRKSSKAIKGIADARENIRGASNLVDGVRCAYAMWLPEDDEARKVCDELRIPFSYGRVIHGAVVKTNRRSNQAIATYIRTDDGLLLDRTSDLSALRPRARAGLEEALIEAVATQAAAKQPVNYSGENGLFAQRHRLPEPLRELSRHRLEGMAQKLLNEQRLMRCVVPGSKTAKVLDVPGGLYDIGSPDWAIGGVRAEGHKKDPHLKAVP